MTALTLHFGTAPHQIAHVIERLTWLRDPAIWNSLNIGADSWHAWGEPAAADGPVHARLVYDVDDLGNHGHLLRWSTAMRHLFWDGLLHPLSGRHDHIYAALTHTADYELNLAHYLRISLSNGAPFLQPHLC